MAIINTTSHIPGNVLLKTEGVANDNSAPKLNSQEFETVQVQKTRDHPLEQNSQPPKQEISLKNFISKPLIKFTTISSAAMNIISGPVRLFDDNNPLKKIINQISMLGTRIHLLSYATAGLIAAYDQKNPLFVFSNIIEGLAAVLGLRNVYLFRGIGTGVDGMIAGIKNKTKRTEFNNFLEGWNYSASVAKSVFKDFINKLLNNPSQLLKIGGDDLAIVSSAIASIGSIIGMTLHEKIGAALRDFGGVGGDYGIFKMDSHNAKKAGFFYLAGSIADFSARIFNKGVAKLLGINNVSSFERLRDLFFEEAIAFDKIGQLFFLRYNQENEESLKSPTTDDHQGYLDFVKSKVPKLSPALELAKVRNYTTSA